MDKALWFQHLWVLQLVPNLTVQLYVSKLVQQQSLTWPTSSVQMVSLTGSEAAQLFLAGSCDVYTTDRSALAAQRANFPSPDDYVVLPEVVSKEPLGPLVRHGDNEWADIARWTLNALITAEELGVTSDNIAEMSAGTNNPEINRLLGTEGTLGEMLGLDAEWAKRAIMSGGNYGEVFEGNIGASTNIGLSRGLNAQWTDGGLIYSPPSR